MKRREQGEALQAVQGKGRKEHQEGGSRVSERAGRERVAGNAGERGTCLRPNSWFVVEPGF